MKKIISLILAASMMLGTALTLTSCKKKVSTGTEAAKLLLANERLDENLIAQKIDIGLNGIGKSTTAMRMATPLSYSVSALKSEAAKSWSDFPTSNDSASQFEAFLINIEYEAARVAKDIANMKSNVGVVDKWVKVGSEKHLLSVYDNKDALFVQGMYDDVHAYYRYTDENADNVYEMFSFMKYDDGTTGEIRTVYVPGSRYEYQYINSNGFEDYVTMENSRGYWVGNRYSYFDNGGDPFAHFSPTIIKDNFCYSVTVEMHKNEIRVYNFTVVDLISGNELISLSVGEESSTFTLYASGIKSGLISLGADEIRDDNGIYTSDIINELITSTGIYAPSDGGMDENGKPERGFVGGYVNYDYGAEIFRGYIVIQVNTPSGTIDEAFAELSKYLDKYGLTLYRPLSEIREQTKHADVLGEDFTEVFEWYGYKLDSLASFESARTALIDSFGAIRSEYEGIKNNPTANGKQKLDKNTAFSPISITQSADNSYTGGTLTIGNTVVNITDTALLESEKQYVLKVALSLTDESGNPLSVNTVELDGGTSAEVLFGDGPLYLAASGSYTVPKNLIAGDYALVVYAATADEGIRVSEMQKIGSFSTYDEKLESAAMDISVKSVGDTLHFIYQIKNSYTVEITSGGKKYTSAEIERLITVEILRKGAPFSSAVLEDANGNEIGEATGLGSGTYRMMCYLNTEDGLAQSYIYLIIK